MKFIQCTYINPCSHCPNEPSQNGIELSSSTSMTNCVEILAVQKCNLYYWLFQGDTSVVVPFVLCFGVKFLCCLYLMYVFIFLLKFG